MNKKSKLFLVLLTTVVLTINESGFANEIKESGTSFDREYGQKNRPFKKQKDLFERRKSEEIEAKEGLNTSVITKSNYNYLPYVQIGGARFFNVDESAWGMGVDFFIPLWQLSPSHLIFTDFRFYDRTGKPFEGNIHLGYRFLSEENSSLYGIYGAFDRKRSINGNYFNQLTFGIETWYKNLFIGVNYYQPIGKNLKNTHIEDGFESKYVNNIGTILVTPNYYGERAAGGGDAKIGYEFFPGITGYAGGYYFKAKNMGTICGPKVRLSYDYSLDNSKRILKIFDKIGLEGGVQHDQRGDVGFLSLNLRVGLFPNNGNKLQGVARHMVDLVHRDVDIITPEGLVGTGVPQPAVYYGKVVKLVNWNDSGDDNSESELTKTLQKINPVTYHVIIVRKGVGPISKENQTLVAERHAVVVPVGQPLSVVSPHTSKRLSITTTEFVVPTTKPSAEVPPKSSEIPSQCGNDCLEELLKDPAKVPEVRRAIDAYKTKPNINEALEKDFGFDIASVYGRAYPTSPVYRFMQGILPLETMDRFDEFMKKATI